MPKMIGNSIVGATKISEDERAKRGLIKLSYSQAVLLPEAEIYCVLDTSDRGGPKSLAKRWWRWFASASAIEACPASTPKMRSAAWWSSHKWLSSLASNLAGIAKVAHNDSASRRNRVGNLSRALRAVAVYRAGEVAMAKVGDSAPDSLEVRIDYLLQLGLDHSQARAAVHCATTRQAVRP